jgi:hypothetical protein
MKLEKIVKSDVKNKKWTAIFCMCKGESKCCDKEKRKFILEIVDIQILP